MAEQNTIALGMRKPGRETVEFSVVPVSNADAVLPVLKRDFDQQPQRVFGELALDRRLIEVPDSRPFHDVAREVQASRWIMHQDGLWLEGEVLPISMRSLLSRWYHSAKQSGGGRFRPDVGLLGHGNGSGGISNCIMGAATELFLDDYPTALGRVEEKMPWGGLSIHYVDFSQRGELVAGVLPRVVQYELGLATNTGQFMLNPGVTATLEQHAGVPAPDLVSQTGMWSLMGINDHLLNWPLAADLMAMPAPGLFERG